MKRILLLCLVSLVLLSFIGCERSDEPGETNKPDPISLSLPSGDGLSEMTATDITIDVIEKFEGALYSATYESQTTRTATDAPSDKNYYTVSYRMGTGGGDILHIKKIYDTSDITEISSIISAAEFAPIEDNMNLGARIERFVNGIGTETYGLDLADGYLYRESEQGGTEKSTAPLSENALCRIALAFFMSPNYEIVSNFGAVITEGYAYTFGCDELTASTNLEITLEYATYKVVLDDEASRNFYNEQLGGGNCKLKRNVQYGKRELLPQNCIKYICKKTTTAIDGSASVTETILYIDVNDTVIVSEAKNGESIWVDSTVYLSATASDNVYITYDAISFDFEDILAFMEQELNEKN